MHERSGPRSVSAVTNTEDTELLLLRRKQTLVRTDAVQHPSEDYKSFMKIWLHASRHITINTDGEEETRKSPMGRGHWVTDVCYSLKELWIWNWQGFCHAMSNQFRVLTSRALRFCKDFSVLQINTSQQLFLRLLTTRACGRKAGLLYYLADLGPGLFAFNSICSSHTHRPWTVTQAEPQKTWPGQKIHSVHARPCIICVGSFVITGSVLSVRPNMGANFKEKTKTNKKLGNLAYFWRAVPRPLETEKKKKKKSRLYTNTYLFNWKIAVWFLESILLQWYVRSGSFQGFWTNYLDKGEWNYILDRVVYACQ